MSFSLDIKHSNTDEWYTPASAVRLIIPYLRKNNYHHILCPFDTIDSEYVKVLTAEGFDVHYSHISTGGDFFEIEDIDSYDAVVSNPPFSKRQEILERLFSAGVPFALILNFNGLFDNKKRWEMFRNNPFEIIVPLGRIHFYNDGCSGKSPQFQSVYVCRGMCNSQIEFAEC